MTFDELNTIKDAIQKMMEDLYRIDDFEEA